MVGRSKRSLLYIEYFCELVALNARPGGMNVNANFELMANMRLIHTDPDPKPSRPPEILPREPALT